MNEETINPTYKPFVEGYFECLQQTKLGTLVLSPGDLAYFFNIGLCHEVDWICMGSQGTIKIDDFRSRECFKNSDSAWYSCYRVFNTNIDIYV